MQGKRAHRRSGVKWWADQVKKLPDQHKGTMKDYYGLLGVSPDVTTELIKTAYRKKAAQFHPDRNPAPDAATKFREVQEAYEVLADVDRRKVYDETRRSSLIDDPLAVAREIWSNHLGKMQQ